MSVDEIERLLTEEIAADAYAGLNWFSGDAPVQEAVRTEAERNAPARRAEAQQETTGPPEGRGTIVVLPDGKKYVQADRQVIFGNDPNSWADQIEGYINADSTCCGKRCRKRHRQRFAHKQYTL